MKITTMRFGDVEYKEEDILTFSKGILGFPHERQFILLSEVIQAPFMWLQSLKTSELAFVVLDPWIVIDDYELDLTEELKQRLGIIKEEQVMILGITVIPENLQKMTINLRAPLVVNIDKKLGEQYILSNEQYDVRHPIIFA